MYIQRLAYVLVIAGIAGVQGCKKGEKPGQEPPTIRNLSVSVAPTAPTGSPAITPRTTGTPAFSVDDAKQYVTTHPLPMGLDKGGKVTITEAEFVTSKEMSQRLGGMTTGFPDDYQLCYVELAGPFTFVGPPGSKVTYNRGVLIFDGHTGNLVIGGGKR